MQLIFAWLVIYMSLQTSIWGATWKRTIWKTDCWFLMDDDFWSIYIVGMLRCFLFKIWPLWHLNWMLFSNLNTRSKMSTSMPFEVAWSKTLTVKNLPNFLLFIWWIGYVQVLAAIPYLWTPFLGISLVFMLVYVWSREYPNAQINLYGLVALKVTRLHHIHNKLSFPYLERLDAWNKH